MNWNNIFKSETPKATSVYESALFDEFLDYKNLKESSKTTYRSYRDRFVEILKSEGVTTPDVNIIEKWLIGITESVNPKQAYARWVLFRDYINWLIIRGKMTVNVWEMVDLKLCGCDRDTANEYAKKLKAAHKAAHKPAVEPKAEKDDKRFSLSDVALLLLAIEDNDEEAILSILGK